LLYKFQSSAFVFKNSDFITLNSKYFENSKSLSCRVRRKTTGKGAGNFTKNGKAFLAKRHEICGEEFQCQCRIFAYCPATK